MESNRVIVVIIVSVCLWKTSSTGSISLCSDSFFSFVNGTTIPAMLGKPVTVVFCVQCKPGQTISPYVRIEHRYYSTSYYTNNDEQRPIKVNIDFKTNTPIVKITIKNVKNTDLNNAFSVRINTNKNIGDNIVFVFKLGETATSDTTPSDTTRIISSETNTIPVTSIVTWTTLLPTTSSSKMSLSTTSPVHSTAATTSMNPVMSTEEVEQCWPDKTTRCPENWYQVDSDTCLLVIPGSNNTLPKPECNERGSEPVKRRNMNKFRTCLQKILEESWTASTNYVIRLNKTHYINVQSGEETTTPGHFSVACIQRTFGLPTVSNFSVLIWNESRQSFVQISTEDITLNKINVHARFTCHGEGHPQPDVTIKDESHEQIRSGVTVVITCRQAGVFSCTVNNSLGSSQAHRTIQIASPVTLKQFTVARKPLKKEIRFGDTVEMSCSFYGCPKQVTITSNNHPIAESTTYTTPLVHEIKSVNCSHMGTYTCLARSQSGQDFTKTADLELTGCPVSLCQGQDTSRKMSPSLGDVVSFSICLMSSESLRYSTNQHKIIVNLTKDSLYSFYWTANITMYNIQETDYTTHTINIENSKGSLEYHITLKSRGISSPNIGHQAQESESESNVVLIVLLPICFIIIVCIIIGITLYRVKGTRIFRSRAEKSSDSRDETSGEVLYANLKETSSSKFSEVKEEDHEQEEDKLECQENDITTDLNDKDSGRIITDDGLVYITVVSANKQVQRKSQRGQSTSKPGCDDEGHVEYLKLDFEKTGKFIIADEEENKEEHVGEEIEIQQNVENSE